MVAMNIYERVMNKQPTMEDNMKRVDRLWDEQADIALFSDITNGYGVFLDMLLEGLSALPETPLWENVRSRV